MLLTQSELERCFEPWFEEIRLCSGDSEEEFKPHKARLVEFYYLCFEIAEEEYYKQNPPKPKKPENPQTILNSKIEIPENTNPIIRKEIILMSNKFGQVLGNRATATQLKEKLKSNIKNNIHTKLNFKGVLYTSPSFVDEGIAIVLIAAGEDHFNRKVSIVYTNRQVKDMINYTIKSRKDFYIEIGFVW